jgi:hypothetical protein
VELSSDFREHVAVTEGTEGLHGDIVTTAPRLSKAVERLIGEHAVIVDLVGGLLTGVSRPLSDSDVVEIRDLGTNLLALLARHRQRGADLIYEAYQVDLGGET